MCLEVGKTASAQLLRRSTGRGLLQVPLMSEARLVGTRERRAFAAVVLQLWNSLPKETRLALTLLVFHWALKMELFISNFYPPIETVTYLIFGAPWIILCFHCFVQSN